MRAYESLLGWLDRVSGWVIIAVMAGMVVIVTTQVVLRYVFNDSLDWAEDIARLLFVWAIFLALPIGVGRGTHIAIELFTGLLGPGPRAWLGRGMSAACAGLMAVVCWQAAVLTVEQWEELMTTIDVTVALFMAPVAWGAGHAALHFVAIALRGPAPLAERTP